MFKKKDELKDLHSRVEVIWMHPSALVQFMTSSRWVITEGHLPEDVQFSHVYWDASRNVWGLVVMASEFKEVKVGQQMPELPPIKFRFYNPAKDGIIE